MTPLAVVGLFLIAAALAVIDALAERKRTPRPPSALAPGPGNDSSDKEDQCVK